MAHKQCLLSLLLMLAKSWCGVVDNAIHLRNTSTARLRKLTLGSASNNTTRRLESTLSWFALNSASLLVGQEPITMFGTTFTVDNYQREMFDFLVAGRTDDNGVAAQQWYLKGTGETEVKPGSVRAGPGPNTETHLGFDDVKRLLSQYPTKIMAGTLERGNELGMQVLGSGAWPEAPGGIKSIGLGQTKDNHAFVRPYLANALDKGSWSDEWLRQRAGAFFSSRDKLESSDVSWWVVQVLHKIHLDIDLDHAQAKEFANYMANVVLLIPFPEAILKSSVMEKALSVQDTLAKKAEYLETLTSAIKTKYAGEDFVINGDDAKISLLASVMLDSLQFAGGISVPTVINSVLAMTHMADGIRHDSLKQLTLDQDNYVWILWETLRRYAPVAGVPSWEKMEDGSFKHVIPNLEVALKDSTLFDSPLEFKDRGSAVYQSKLRNTGMPWAGPAVQLNTDGNADTSAPHSHNCPAQDLSFRMMKAFIEAFIANGGSLGWSAMASASITITNFGPSAITLLKRGLTHKTGCAYFPTCQDGYSRVSTEFCWWARRDWTCKVL